MEKNTCKGSCKGCHIRMFSLKCVLQETFHSADKICPCNSCLVKITCDSFCDKRLNIYQEDWVQEYRKFKLRKRYKYDKK